MINRILCILIGYVCGLFQTGFFYGKPNEETQIYDSNTYNKSYTYLGLIGRGITVAKLEKELGKTIHIEDKSAILYEIEQRNKFSVSEEIEVMKTDGTNEFLKVLNILDENGENMDSCPHPKQKLYINMGTALEMYNVLRRKEES